MARALWSVVTDSYVCSGVLVNRDGALVAVMHADGDTRRTLKREQAKGVGDAKKLKVPVHKPKKRKIPVRRDAGRYFGANLLEQALTAAPVAVAENAVSAGLGRMGGCSTVGPVMGYYDTKQPHRPYSLGRGAGGSHTVYGVPRMQTQDDDVGDGSGSETSGESAHIHSSSDEGESGGSTAASESETIGGQARTGRVRVNEASGDDSDQVPELICSSSDSESSGDEGEPADAGGRRGRNRAYSNAAGKMPADRSSRGTRPTRDRLGERQGRGNGGAGGGAGGSGGDERGPGRRGRHDPTTANLLCRHVGCACVNKYDEFHWETCTEPAEGCTRPRVKGSPYCAEHAHVMKVQGEEFMRRAYGRGQTPEAVLPELCEFQGCFRRKAHQQRYCTQAHADADMQLFPEERTARHNDVCRLEGCVVLAWPG